MAAKRRCWKKTWSEFFQASPDVRLVVMVTNWKIDGMFKIFKSGAS